MITQRQALARMEEETRKYMRRLEDEYGRQLGVIWEYTLKELRFRITDAYRQDFGKDTWDIAGAHARGTLDRIKSHTADTLGAFLVLATTRIGVALKHIREEERLRALWMIDQVTPDSFMPNVMNFMPAREADSPRDAKATWNQALSTWIDTYHANLNTNLKMEALHEGDVNDAAAEAESTKVDNFDPAYKLASMFSGESIRAEADARRDVFDANDDSVEEEVWVTMEDGSVCPICNDYDGKPLSEIEDDIPAHYNCRCYTRFVPKAWAAMLRSGDPEEKERALQMDDRGLVPDSMAIYSTKTGELIGRAIVTFEDWKSGRGQNIAGFGV